MLQENDKKDRQAELLDMKFALVEISENAEEKHNLTNQNMQGLEEKVQELSVQVNYINNVLFIKIFSFFFSSSSN